MALLTIWNLWCIQRVNYLLKSKYYGIVIASGLSPLKDSKLVEILIAITGD